MSGDAFKQLRIAIIGGCQVTGLGAAAQHLLPGAEVKIWHVGVYPNDSDEELLAILPGFDVTISQLSDWDHHEALRITRLRERGLPVVYLPVMAFTGFHPDLTHIQGPEGLVQGLATDYHSLIVAAAFTLGLQEQRVPGLFNAFVFSALGYFEVFEAAKPALFAAFDQEAFDLRPLFTQWMQQVGQFMYTINHPHILVLSSLCRLALARAGHIDSAAPLPAEMDDYLATHFTWPIYPDLAKRIGLAGSTTFLINSFGLPPGQTRELPLADYVSGCFDRYRLVSSNTLRAAHVIEACDRMRAFIVI